VISRGVICCVGFFMLAYNVLQAGAEAANKRIGRAAFELACCYGMVFLSVLLV
jgi:hypothetical protein